MLNYVLNVKQLEYREKLSGTRDNYQINDKFNHNYNRVEV